MQYMLLIYEDEDAARQIEPTVRQSQMAGYRAFTQAIISSGEFKAGDQLQPSTTATSVRVREGELLITDGPFAETREVLGGYYLVEAENLDRAITLARQIPGAETGTIEIRPVVVYNA